jgi:hypothetical protein
MENYRDTKLTGFISGIIAPLIFLIIFWFTVLQSRFQHFNLVEIINRNQAAPLLGLGQIANAALFFFFIKKWEADESSKGVIFAMLFYGAFIVYFKISSGGLF